MTTQAETRFDHDRSTSVARLDLLRARLAVELARAGRPDLLSGIDDRWSVAATGPVRVVTVGETKRGKSTLVNTLVGRPLLSPVGVDVTTSCWLEVSYGDRDEAEVLLADSKSLGEPRIMPCELREVERYASLDDVTEPVVGVRVRVRSDLLRDMVLIDTPGVGGLVAGHSRTTLAALGRADALLFVCDARQPILEPEVRFLLEAAKRVPRVVVAITKCDANSNSEEVVSETRRRIAEQESLRDAPVFAVAAPLADLAHEIDDERASARLTQLSGIGPLVTTLTQQARAGGSAVRFSNAVAVAGNVARLLLRSAQEMATEMTGEVDRESAIAGEIARLGNLLNDGGRLALLAQHHMAQLRTGPVDMFDAQLSELEARFCAAAEHDPAAQLTTLAPRMVADVTAAGVAALEAAADQSMTLMRRLLDEIGAVGVIAGYPLATLATSMSPWRPPRSPEATWVRTSAMQRRVHHPGPTSCRICGRRRGTQRTGHRRGKRGPCRGRGLVADPRGQRAAPQGSVGGVGRSVRATNAFGIPARDWCAESVMSNGT